MPDFEKERKPREEKDGKKKKRAKKDPNAPKRALSAYFVWFTEKRSSIKKEGDSVADTSKRAGEMWKKMSDNEKKVCNLLFIRSDLII